MAKTSKLDVDLELQRSIKQLINEGVSQQQVAERVGINQGALSRWMKKHGYRRIVQTRWELVKEVE